MGQSNRVFIQKEKILELLRRYPKKYYLSDLKKIARLSMATIRKLVDKEGVGDLLKQCKPPVKRSQPETVKSNFFTFNSIDEIF